ncbi:MAG: hypothetical protein EOO38_09050 [Cytophagaceae bacterium]|nr:MAG: hypothetical protein EOO38_09050 [Cytophagaceae bacterium]
MTLEAGEKQGWRYSIHSLRVSTMVNPPAFWMPVVSFVADITSWFDWDALSAIGSMGALSYIAVQTTRQTRLDRQRALGTLTSIIELLKHIPDLPFDDKLDNAALARMEDEDLKLYHGYVQRAQVGLASMPLNDLSSLNIVIETFDTRAALIDFDKVLSTRDVGSFPTLSKSYGDIERMISDLRERRAKIQYNWFERYIDTKWIEANNRYHQHVFKKGVAKDRKRAH